ncbi:DUF6286 domain-containing protein [Streptomyces corynorhini]|uniref:DUF6286 domain-containing protein n=1 Tax=Streptomyces corynorhini TaxID=2282652 RepID=A0A370B460_9ACTN|nr:DUF6286 domain-containing protein [Streptomyces corynorhini]RDG34526.1 hypothetical protein DVH02_30075 [Streptomyces corynorhini]
MKRRPRRSAPATLTALALLAACTVVAVVAVQMIAGQTPWISYGAVAGDLRAAHWNDRAPAVAGGIAALIGLIMVMAAVLPGRPTVLPLAGELDSGASWRGLRSTLRTAAADVDGVNRVTLRLRRRRVAARVRTDRTNTEGLADAVRTALEQRLDQIDPARRPDVKVTLRATRSTS